MREKAVFPGIVFSAVSLATALVLATPTLSRSQDAPTADQWLQDLQFFVSALESTHLSPYHRDTEEEFKSAVTQLEADIPSLEPSTIVVRMMQVIARLEDGHTMLRSLGSYGFDSWFPVRFQNFSDGLFITVIDSAYSEFVGSQVMKVGGLSSEEAFALVGTVVAADNDFSRSNFTPLYLSNATVMSALGIIPSPDSLPLDLITRTGERRAVSLRSMRSELDFFWFYRTLDGPPGGNYVTAFPASEDSLPLHLRNQFTVDYMYWFEHLKEQRALYMQFNSVADSWEETFAHFTDRLWKFYEANSNNIDKFILDVRYNNGGNGYMLLPFIHEFIKHEDINEKSRLFTLVGNKTVSAGVTTCALMKRHTNTLLVGEPAGGPFNSYSDPIVIRLPNSGLEVWIPTLYHQHGDAWDDRNFYPPDYPIITSSEDYFAGRDRVLEAVLNDEVKLLGDILLEDGAGAFLREYRRLEPLASEIAWWEPFSRRELERLGIQLLEAGRVTDLITVFRLNTERHPESWRAWDYLGEAHLAGGDERSALECFRRSFELNPDNVNARQRIDEIERGRP
jgi:hypothetical protein